MPRKQYKNIPEDLREKNTRLVLAQFLRHDTRTIADLERSVGISKTTIIKIVTQLLEAKLLLSQGKAGPSEDKGRRPIVYSFNRDYKYILSLQMLPNEIHLIVTDLRNEILYSSSSPIAREIEYVELLGVMEEAIKAALRERNIPCQQVEALCIASAGPTNYADGVLVLAPRFPNLPMHMQLKLALMQRFPDLPRVIVENEMRLQALAEQRYGISGTQNIVLEAGDKLVAGMINDHNEQIRGRHSTAGEIGHMMLDPHSRVRCVCGSYGCFLALVSTSRMLALVGEYSRRYPDSALHRLAGPPKAADVLRCFEQGDPLCEVVMDDIARWFGQGLANIILMYDPQTIVIQGIYTHAGERFLEKIRQYTLEGKYPLLQQLDTSIVFSSMGSDAGVLGGSILVSEQFLAEFTL